MSRASRTFTPSGKAISEYFPLPGFTVRERNVNDLVAILFAPIPRPVKRDECSAAVTLGKHCSIVEHEAVRPPVTGKADKRQFLVGAPAHCVAVAAILGRQHFLARPPVEEAVRPAEIITQLDAHELFGRQIVIVLRRERSKSAEVIPSVLRCKHSLQRRVVREANRVADARRKANTALVALIRRIGAEQPDARALRELTTRILTR